MHKTTTTRSTPQKLKRLSQCVDDDIAIATEACDCFSLLWQHIRDLRRWCACVRACQAPCQSSHRQQAFSMALRFASSSRASFLRSSRRHTREVRFISSPAAGGTDGSRPPTTVKTALVTGHVFVITIDRPEKRNCVDPNTARQLVAAFQAFEANKDARVAILTGSGGTFCAGFDLKFLSSADKDDLRSVLESTPQGVGPMVRSQSSIG